MVGEGGETSLRFPFWPRQCTHLGQPLASSEQQSALFYAPAPFEAVGEEVIRQRKELVVQDLCFWGAQKSGHHSHLCVARDQLVPDSLAPVPVGQKGEGWTWGTAVYLV